LFNPLNAELNPICPLLALSGAHHILHISGLRVNNSIPNFVLPGNSSWHRQKSISVEFSFATVFAFKHHVSAAYVILLLTIT